MLVPASRVLLVVLVPTGDKGQKGELGCPTGPTGDKGQKGEVGAQGPG